MLELAWPVIVEFMHEGHEITLSQTRIPGPSCLAYRASTELAGVWVHRYAPKPEEAVCELLNGLSDIAIEEALDALEAREHG